MFSHIFRIINIDSHIFRIINIDSHIFRLELKHTIKTYNI